MINTYAVILTCFNRKDTTLRCLKQLCQQKTSGNMDVFLCDDASTDGTSEAVQKQFPKVHIVRGNGNLFWNRGMLAAWEEACATKQYDAYIWLNDDVALYDDAIAEMMECSSLCDDKSIICGAFCTNDGKFSYGGKTKDNFSLIPNGKLQSVYWLNGNCVLVPNFVVKKIGLLDGMFQHHMGDFDYGLRAKEAGIGVYTSRKYVGECAQNPMASSRGRKSGKTLHQRFKILYSPLGDNPIINFKYTRKHFGLIKAISIFISLHINNLLSDRLYELKSTLCKNKKSK